MPGTRKSIGTMGQLPAGAVTLIETVADAEKFAPADASRLAYITQTTLSVDDTAEIVARAAAALSADRGAAQGRHLLRHDQPAGSGEGDRAARGRGARHRRAEFVELDAAGRSRGARGGAGVGAWCSGQATSIGRMIEGARVVGLTAGASAPDVLIAEVIDAFRARYDVTVEETETARETVQFRLPRALALERVSQHNTKTRSAETTSARKAQCAVARRFCVPNLLSS